LLAVCAALSLAALAVALSLQYLLGKPPCAWCALLRLVFVLVAAVCVIGALMPRQRFVQVAAALAADGLATAGAVAALYLHFVASQSDSCGVSLADKLMMSLSLYETVPWLFYADAPCNEGNPLVLGVPFALWAFAGLVVIALGSVIALVALLRSPRATSGA